MFEVMGKKKHERSIVEFNHEEARVFFLKNTNYFRLELPSYFEFEPILNIISDYLDGNTWEDKLCNKPNQIQNINYHIIANKDGKYAWRPFEIIHPLLYVSLIHDITDQANWNIITNKLREFQDNSIVECASVPKISEKDSLKKTQILAWWSQIEQRSIELSIDYEYLYETDITNCYGSIYTHSIAWAIHGRENAKKNRGNKNMLGNKIDEQIRNMKFAESNGIIQGSVIMDCIAELVLGYADILITEKVRNINDKFKIIRFRDDYRIFVNNPEIGEKILKTITEVLITLGMQLNSNKTRINYDVITASIKRDKLEWLQRNQKERNLEKQLLLIYSFSKEHPNSGTLITALSQFYNRIINYKKRYEIFPIVSILTDLAVNNPRLYPIYAAIMSKLISLIDNKNIGQIVEKVKHKFAKKPNTNYIDIWLQRITDPYLKVNYEDSLCKIKSGDIDCLWDISWISCKDIKNIFKTPIINEKELNLTMKQNKIISSKEIDLIISNQIRYY